jgi:hypothetical protein
MAPTTQALALARAHAEIGRLRRDNARLEMLPDDACQGCEQALEANVTLADAYRSECEARRRAEDALAVRSPVQEQGEPFPGEVA